MNEPGWSDGECRLCAVAGQGGDRLEPDGTVVKHVGEYATVLVRPELDEVLVAPSRHVVMLGALCERSLGQFLAALRRVVMLMRAGGGTVTLEPTKESVGAEGHLCVRVVHDPRDEAASRSEDARELARRLES